MKTQTGTAPYFPFDIPIHYSQWHLLELGTTSRLISERGIPRIIFYRQLSMKLNRRQDAAKPPVHAGQLNLFATIQNVYRYIIDVLAEQQQPGILLWALQKSGLNYSDPAVGETMHNFIGMFPPANVLEGGCTAEEWLQQTAAGRETVLREMLLVRQAVMNPATSVFQTILDDSPLCRLCPDYPRILTAMHSALDAGPLLPGLDMTLSEVLNAPLKASPGSLSGQIGFIAEHWRQYLPAELLEEVTIAFDILLEEERERGWGGEPGPPPVLEFGPKAKPGAPGLTGGAADGSSVFGGYDYPEYERFSHDVHWMPNVVLMAKMVYVWLDQLSRQYGYPVSRLDQIPDAELDRLAEAGFTGLWLIGIWERSPASQRIKQICGNPEAIASAYSLYDYEIAQDLGGWEALASLRDRALARGIRLASDMVPNHTGIYSRWVIQHPDWFIQTDYPPFPTYQFNGENLSQSDQAVIQIEDGYWSKSDAAVVFRYIERSSGRVRYIYHGNDGTSIPWNDTAQLNYLLPEVREAVIQTILHVARNFPIIRFDAAMTLAKKHYERLWFPLRGLGGGIPSRAEHGMSREEFDRVFPEEFWRNVVDRVAAEAPGTLLLAEAFWMMEGYFVRTLGMHRVYNSAFMNMLKKEENAKYRQTIANVLEFNPEILKRFVNFMNNPDEKTAVEQFGSQGKYFGACVLMTTMPGLPMFGHGQIEGFREKYGMEYKRAYWDESVDEGLMRGHEMWIFPLLRRRWLFSESENFALYDFHAAGHVDQNVYAYSNRVDRQRALIIYNNAYANTAGWIRESVSYAAKTGPDTQELHRHTLVSALDLVVDEGVFYSFRDIISNRYFLRRSREIDTKGLYAELGEYEFHVFIDFDEIRDDAEQSWERLCSELNGAGVEDLHSELLLCLHRELNHAFSRLLLDAVQALPAAAEATAEEIETVAASGTLLTSLLAEQAEKPAASAPDITELFSRLKAIATLQTRDEECLKLQQLATSAEGISILVPWLYLRQLDPLLLDTLGLAVTLRRHCLKTCSSGSPPCCSDPAGLLAALIANGQTAPEAGASLIETTFRNSCCRDYMLVHESSATVWFNQERFEELLLWLTLLELLSDTTTAPLSPARLAKLFGEQARLRELAGHAGYRLTLFLRLAAADDSEKAITSNSKNRVTHAKYSPCTPVPETQDDQLPD